VTWWAGQGRCSVSIGSGQSNSGSIGLVLAAASGDVDALPAGSPSRVAGSTAVTTDRCVIEVERRGPRPDMAVPRAAAALHQSLTW
jgi:hypothetical protein